MNNVLIPQGDQVVTVELTLKEAMALSGYRFIHNPEQLAVARSKVRKALDSHYISEAETKIAYEELTH